MGKKQTRNKGAVQYPDNSTTTGGKHVGALLTHSEYFAAYGRNLSVTSGPYEAWLETEKEFNRTFSVGEIVFWRYINFNSFRDAFRRWQAGEQPDRVILHIRYVQKV